MLLNLGVAVPEGGKALLFTVSPEGVQAGPGGLRLSGGVSRALGWVVGSPVSWSWVSRPLLACPSFPQGSGEGGARMAASAFSVGGMAGHPCVTAGMLGGWVTGSG